MQIFKKHSEIQNQKMGDELAILKSDFEVLQQEVVFNDLIICKRNRHIGYAGEDENLPFEIMHQINGVDFYGYKSSYEALGLYLFQLLFSQESYIHLKITRQQSKIQDLFLHIERNIEQDSFLKSETTIHRQYNYYRASVEKFPFSRAVFSNRILKEDDVPVFLLSCSDYHNNYLQDRIKYTDQLILNVTTNGLCALATLFLDIAATENNQEEICLEHPSLGFGGTGNNSIEARFWLPNSFGFYCDSLDDLNL